MGSVSRDHITTAQVRAALDYCRSSGEFKWKKGGRSGKVAGCQRSDGYRIICISGKLYYAHRLAYLYEVGEIDGLYIDHISGDTTDNSMGNIRAVTKSGNSKNAKIPSNNKSGVIGVHWNARSGKWKAEINSEGSKEYLGIFEKLEDAKKARRDAEFRLGFHKNHGRIQQEGIKAKISKPDKGRGFTVSPNNENDKGAE